MVQAKVSWLHHFWGNYYATIYAWFPKEQAHIAKAFGEKFLGLGYEVKTCEDPNEVVCGIFAKNGADKVIAERLRIARIEDDKCPRCGEIHDVGDTAHSIDRATPITIEVGLVDHPSQRVLFAEETHE